MDIEEIRKTIELAIMANGGENHRREWCQCDPSVGYKPCEYCAVFNGLNKTKDLLSEVDRLKELNIELIKGIRAGNQRIKELKARVKELEEGIEDHRDRFATCEELYKLLEGK